MNDFVTLLFSRLGIGMFRALFSAKGRMRRRDWWLSLILLGVVFVVAGTLFETWFGGRVTRGATQFGKAPLTPYDAWMTFINTIGFWPYVCINAKRWHDRNRSGWLASLFPTIGILQFALLHFSDLLNSLSSRSVVGAVDATLVVVGALVLIWIVVDCGILDGTQGPNRYGPSPKGVGAQTEDIF